MDADEVQTWADAYDESFDDSLNETEQRLHEKFQDQGYITQKQLEAVVKWKLDNQAGRRSRFIDLVNQPTDEYVRLVSEAALAADDPKLQVQTLSSIPGVGFATATVVLTFTDPENYAVGDRYILDVLFDEDKQMGATDYPRILSALEDRNPGGFDLRTVEKAYYQKYRDENGITEDS